jgi:hypothetical protein
MEGTLERSSIVGRGAPARRKQQSRLLRVAPDAAGNDCAAGQANRVADSIKPPPATAIEAASRGGWQNSEPADIDMARSAGEAATSAVWRNRIVDTLRRLIADGPDR